MKRKPLIIFGTGDIAQIAKYYFDIDSEYDVVGFTVDREYCKDEIFEKLPVFPFDELTKRYNPKAAHLFVALSYAEMNKIRADKYHAIREKGYLFASYVSSKCTYLSQFPPGDNAFIFEDNTIQPFVRIGENVTIWSGNHIGHHSTIGSHNFISSHVVISGHCHIKPFCFLGVNSTLAHNVTVEEGTLIGAGAVITKDTQQDGVYVGPRSTKLDKLSSQIKL